MPATIDGESKDSELMTVANETLQPWSEGIDDLDLAEGIPVENWLVL